MLGKLAFQVRLLADPTAPGRLYLTWLDASDVGLYRFSEVGNPIQAIRSDDGGKSWSDPVRVSAGARQHVLAPTPAVGPRGELYVLYLDVGADRLDYDGAHQGKGGKPYDGTFSLVLARSRDHGRTFDESAADTAIRPIDRFVAFFLPAPSLAIDGRSGRVYAGFEDRRFGDTAARSTAPGCPSRRTAGWTSCTTTAAATHVTAATRSRCSRRLTTARRSPRG